MVKVKNWGLAKMKQARKKKKASSGIRFLVQIRAFDLAEITKSKMKQKMKGKCEKDSGRSCKVTPSCKCVAFVDKSALKKLFSRV